MGVDESYEATLTTTLIDPESLDNPSPQIQKGELQDPNRCRDAWAAILFYAQLIAIGCVCGILGVPAVQKNIGAAAAADGSGGASQQIDYTGLIYSE